MKIAVYSSLVLFVMLFIYNTFGECTSDGWNAFYWVGLSAYLAGVNYELYRLAIHPKQRFILFLGLLYWVIFCVAESITFFVGDYFTIISTVNLWLSRSMIVFAGLILFNIKFWNR
jgi:hypothetical protein